MAATVNLPKFPTSKLIELCLSYTEVPTFKIDFREWW